MIVTEDQAKQKICAERCYGAIETMCVGSKCMMWCEYDELGKRHSGDDRPVTRGYCGLAPPMHKKKWRL